MTRARTQTLVYLPAAYAAAAMAMMVAGIIMIGL
jgi:hypothetical protein